MPEGWYHATLNRGGGLSVAIGRQAEDLLELGFAATLTAVLRGVGTGRAAAPETRAAAERGVARWPRDANMAVANAKRLADQDRSPAASMDAAIAEVERSLALNPSNLDARVLRPMLLGRAGRHDEARDAAGALVRELQQRSKQANDEHGMLPAIEGVYARSAAAAAAAGRA